VYNKERTKPYISLDDASGCEQVPVEVTGDYMASTDGLWQTNADFNENHALFLFSFENYAANYEEYRADIATLKALIIELGTICETQNLALNVIMLSTIGMALDNSQIALGIFSTPNVAYWKSIWSPSLGRSGHPDCPALVDVMYDRNVAEFTIQYATAQYLTECANFSTILFDGQDSGSDFNSEFLTFYFFGRSFTTSLSINFNYVDITMLELIQHEASAVFVYNGVQYQLQDKFLPQFPGMTPVECIINFSTGELIVCLVKLGTRVGLPIINHMGNNSGYPEYCDW
jgi:hypothetical protein